MAAFPISSLCSLFVRQPLLRVTFAETYDNSCLGLTKTAAGKLKDDRRFGTGNLSGTDGSVATDGGRVAPRDLKQELDHLQGATKTQGPAQSLPYLMNFGHFKFLAAQKQHAHAAPFIHHLRTHYPSPNSGGSESL